MNRPGDDDFWRAEPPAAPPQHPVPPPAPPSTGPQVERPRFGDGRSAEFTPAYEAQPGLPPGPPASPPVVSPHPPTRSPSSRRSMLAPLVAAIVLIGGIGFLVLRGGSSTPEDADGPSISGVAEPDEPRVDTTIPLQTSPPLVNTPTTAVVKTTPPTTATPSTTTTTTTSTTTTTTLAPPSIGGPSVADVDAALLNIDDLGEGDWTEEVIDLVDVCGTNPQDDAIDIRRDRLFQELLIAPIAVRQVGSTLISYPDDDTAASALSAEVALLEACDATTITLDGVDYRVQVNSDSFTAEQSETFPCADQSSFLILQLTNANALVPYIGQTSVSFRCGRNVTVTALTTTIDVADLTDDDFFNAAGVANIRASSLDGS